MIDDGFPGVLLGVVVIAIAAVLIFGPSGESTTPDPGTPPVEQRQGMVQLPAVTGQHVDLVMKLMEKIGFTNVVWKMGGVDVTDRIELYKRFRVFDQSPIEKIGEHVSKNFEIELRIVQ